MSYVLHLYQSYFIFLLSVLLLHQFSDGIQDTLTGYYPGYGNPFLSTIPSAFYINYVMK